SRLEPVLRIREPFATNQIAIKAAVATLNDEEFVKRHLQENREGKVYLTNELEKMGLDVVNSYTNFLFVHLKRDSVELFKQLLFFCLIIRPCAPWGFDNYARISIGTASQNKQLIEKLQIIFTESE